MPAHHYLRSLELLFTHFARESFTCLDYKSFRRKTAPGSSMPKIIPDLHRQSANRPARIAAQTSLLLLAFALAAAAQTSNLERDQEIVFFPALGHLVDGGKSWELEIHGCVYEPDQRRVALALLRETLDLKHVQMNPAESALFAERARLFMVDHKRGKKIVIRIASKQFVLGKSRPDGQFSGVVRVPVAEVKTDADPALRIRAMLPPGDHRAFAGELNLFADTGIAVISDIDDTIKITQVRDRNATLRNTFLEPFRPVPGMPEVYRGWAEKSGAQFCYVSASPW